MTIEMLSWLDSSSLFRAINYLIFFSRDLIIHFNFSRTLATFYLFVFLLEIFLLFEQILRVIQSVRSLSHNYPQCDKRIVAERFWAEMISLSCFWPKVSSEKQEKLSEIPVIRVKSQKWGDLVHKHTISMRFAVLLLLVLFKQV